MLPANGKGWHSGFALPSLAPSSPSCPVLHVSILPFRTLASYQEDKEQLRPPLFLKTISKLCFPLILLFDFLELGLANFLRKNHIVNILGFEDQEQN